MFVLPDGRVLVASTAEDPIATQVLDLSTQTWSIVDPLPVDGGSAAMYRLGGDDLCPRYDPAVPGLAADRLHGVPTHVCHPDAAAGRHGPGLQAGAGLRLSVG